MVASLLQAYTPLLTWISLGVVLFRFIPANFSTLLGRALYWVGLPLQSIKFGRQTHLSVEIAVIPLIVIEAALISLVLALLFWWGWQKFYELKGEKSSLERSHLGSFIISILLGNTGFIGLTLTGVLIEPDYQDWGILYNVFGTIPYTIAVFISSYLGRNKTQKPWWTPFRDVLTIPSQWAFVGGLLTQNIEFPTIVESGFQAIIWIVFASALLLLGLRLGSIKGWSSMKLALIPAVLKIIIIPVLIGLSATYFGLTGEPRLIMVLMAGVPTALVALILAEVYDLNRELITSSITLTCLGLLLILPVWLFWFG